MFLMAVIASEWPASTAFDHEKAVQVAAFFIRKADGAIDKLKLVKLSYLADRRSFEIRSAPINFDDFYSMTHGPVSSSMLNGLDKKFDGPWSALAVNGVKISLIGEVQSDRLSRNDLSILEDTWSKFGSMSTWTLRNWTHKNCPEYEEVTSGRLSIGYDEILEALGNEEANVISRDLRKLQRDIGRLPPPNAS